jgi:hypothetical protein
VLIIAGVALVVERSPGPLDGPNEPRP